MTQLSTTNTFTAEYAQMRDEADPLKRFRDEFLIPQHQRKPVAYFCGNSLGLQPKAAEDSVKQELRDWSELGVEGHTQARRPWVSYHELLTEALAEITGSLRSEVVAMNALTVNLHLLMASFYRPNKERFRILCEAKAFPSDQYALQSQAEWHGLMPAEVIREIHPREGQHHIELDDILQAIREEGSQLALVMIGGVNYYSGQVFDMETITREAHKVGAIAGFDLAHAIGNIHLKLHEWNVDFAAWCSYKYLNSGPGGTAGIFIHEKHASSPETFRLKGWWGHNKAERFKMGPDFEPIPTAESWQMSNAPVLSMAVQIASLELFRQAGMTNLLGKSKALTAYADQLLSEVMRQGPLAGAFEIITPKDRGCQLSLLFSRHGRAVFDYLTANGVIADWREPNVIRIAPVPLYNQFSDIYRLASLLAQFPG
jgi:kynureninase